MYGINFSSLLINRFTKYGYEIRTRGYGTKPSLPINRVVYPDPTNKTRLTTTVRVRLKSTLTTNQKRHPLPIY
jgi:hypothetical protein